MIKGIYQIPPHIKMKLPHLNIWWSNGVEPLNKGFTYVKGLHLYCKGIQYVNDIWDSNTQNIFTWENAQEKFKLLPTEERDWRDLTDKISGQ